MSVAHSIARPPSKYSVAHCSDQALLCDVVAYYGQEHVAKTEFLIRLAEIEIRELYLPAGYSSMLAYCRGELRMSRDKALKRMKAARAANEFPAIYDAIADGRIELSVVVVLEPHLTEENVEKLLAAAAGLTKSEVEQLVSQRVPLLDSSPQSLAIDSESAQIDMDPVAPGLLTQVEVAPGLPAQVASAPESPPVMVAPARIPLRFTVDAKTYELLQRAQDLLSHQIPSGSVPEVFRRALELLVRHYEKRKFGTTDRPRASKKRASSGSRYIPADVRRAVKERDQGRCTFVSDTGHRCESRRLLEFDHVHEFARGGEATVENLRLRCRAHNQYTAEQTFGTGFMRQKREAAQRAAAEQRVARATERARAAAEAEQARAAAKARAEAEAEKARERDVVPWLRSLGFRADEARQASRLCEDIPDAALEERVRVALSFFRPRGTVRFSPTTA